MKKLILTLCTISLIAVLSGCSGGDERNHPLFRKGENAQKAGNHTEAVGFYKDLLKRRSGCKYVHLKLAEIYDESLKDPQMAALHYRLYLEAIPDAPDAEEVKAWQKNAEKRYYESLSSKFESKKEIAVQGKTAAESTVAASKTVFKLAISAALPEASAEDLQKKVAGVIEKELANSQSAISGLLHFSSVCGKDGKYLCTLTFSGNGNQDKAVSSVHDLLTRVKTSLPAEAVRSGVSVQVVTNNAVDTAELKKLKAELAESQNKLAQFRARYRFMQIELNRLRNIEREYKILVNTQKNVRTHQVQKGENLGSIALKYYGKSSLYYLIERANPGVDGNKLRAGMVLMIPEY